MEDLIVTPYDIDTTLGVEEVDEKKDKKENNGAEFMQDNGFRNEEFRNMWIKMHTPWKSKIRTGTHGHKTGRNEICPYCTSGKKFKKCECYERYKADPFIAGGSQANI